MLLTLLLTGVSALLLLLLGQARFTAKHTLTDLCTNSDSDSSSRVSEAWSTAAEVLLLATQTLSRVCCVLCVVSVSVTAAAGGLYGCLCSGARLAA